MTIALDSFKRPLKDLRISVTDRCNLRCSYCMPPEHFGADHCFLERDELLSFEEISRLAKTFAELGVNKIRLTGGEPLLRKGISSLVEQLVKVSGIDSVTLSSNGLLLGKFAQELKDAGLHRVNVSLDALDNDILKNITNRECTSENIIDAIDKAQAIGLSPKVNMVVKKGNNDSQILPMVKLFKSKGITLRFIEFMDVGNHNEWDNSKVFPSQDILNIIGKEFEFKPLPPKVHGEVAKRFAYTDGTAEFGVITSISQPFCSGCHRARISSKGQLFNCLFASVGHDLRQPLRNELTDKELKQFIFDLWAKRDDRYSEIRNNLRKENSNNKVEMSYIGG